VRELDADVVLFGHGFPLPLLGPDLASRGVPYVVLTHGVEVWMARAPGIAAGLRRACARASAVTAVSRFTAKTVARVVGPGVPLTVLPPGVDAERFSPSVHGDEVRRRLGLEDRLVILCLSRLVPRKGQDMLIRSMPVVTRLVPEATLLIAGGGPYHARLEQLAAEVPKGSVVFAGEVRDEELPAHYAACDVFAMPCRSRWGGLEVEGFGIVFLEASSSGKAVVAGRSGGADEAVADELTGFLVEGSEPKAIAFSLAQLLLDPALREGMGRAGRARVERAFTWPFRAAALAEVLSRAVG
jgi:phosphatidylinositol alpha-1,6-mannosyltransferase